MKEYSFTFYVWQNTQWSHEATLRPGPEETDGVGQTGWGCMCTLPTLWDLSCNHGSRWVPMDSMVWGLTVCSCNRGSSHHWLLQALAVGCTSDSSLHLCGGHWPVPSAKAEWAMWSWQVRWGPEQTSSCWGLADYSQPLLHAQHEVDPALKSFKLSACNAYGKVDLCWPWSLLWLYFFYINVSFPLG